jgi:hypothetical protein
MPFIVWREKKLKARATNEMDSERDRAISPRKRRFYGAAVHGKAFV